MRHVAAHSPLNVISLCTGGGGLDLGLELAIPSSRSVCMVEREAFAVAHLVGAMREGLLGQAPIWSDARTFDGRPWRGLVDGVIGGIPCQPHSLAGKRLGADDERDLWGTARRIIVQSGAWFVLIENVGGMLTSGGAERVWRDLHRLGFEVEGGLFTAEEVGAPHERERLFILAVADRPGIRFGGWLGSASERAARIGRPDAHDEGAQLVDAEGIGRRKGRPEPSIRGRRNPAAGASAELADTRRGGEQRRGGAGNLPGAPEAGDLERAQRQRHGNAARDGGKALADAGGSRSQGRQSGDAAGPRDERRSAQRSGGAVAHPVRRGAATGPGASATHQDAGGARGRLGAEPHDEGGELADADLKRGEAGRLAGLAAGAESGRALAHAPSRTMGDADRGGQFESQRLLADFPGWPENSGGGPLFPPGPGDLDRWRAVLEIAPELEPAFRRMAHGVASRMDVGRVDRLRLLGNGVVPLQTAFAIRTLAHRLARRGWDRLWKLCEQ